MTLCNEGIDLPTLEIINLLLGELSTERAFEIFACEFPPTRGSPISGSYAVELMPNEIPLKAT